MADGKIRFENDPLDPAKIGALIVVTITGEEGSGKTYAVKKLVKEISELGFAHSVPVLEDTSVFYDGTGATTYDEFCALPAKIRWEKNLEVLDRRYEADLNALKSCAAKPEGAMLSVIVQDRPWWDTYYYALKRSAGTDPEMREGFYDALHRIASWDRGVILPRHQSLALHLRPLGPKILSSMKNCSGGPATRPRRCISSRQADTVARAASFADYTVFNHIASELYHSMSGAMFNNVITHTDYYEGRLLVPDSGGGGHEISDPSTGKSWSFSTPSDSRILLSSKADFLAELQALRGLLTRIGSPKCSATEKKVLPKLVTDAVLVKDLDLREARLNSFCGFLHSMLGLFKGIADRLKSEGVASPQEGILGELMGFRPDQQGDLEDGGTPDIPVFHNAKPKTKGSPWPGKDRDGKKEWVH